MGWVSAPVAGHGRVAWIPGSVGQICGYRYQEGEGAQAGTPKCWCGVVRIAECLECGAPLCGDHIRRLSGAVYCEADRSSKDSAQRDAERLRLTAGFLEELERCLSKVSDPVERALCVAASVTAGGVEMRIKHGECRYGHRGGYVCDQFNDPPWKGPIVSRIMESVAGPSEAFGVDSAAGQYRVTAPQLFASWVFEHANATKRVIEIRRVRNFLGGYRHVGSQEVTRINNEYDMLSNGMFTLAGNGITTLTGPRERKHPNSSLRALPEAISDENLVYVLKALKIPIVEPLFLDSDVECCCVLPIRPNEP